MPTFSSQLPSDDTWIRDGNPTQNRGTDPNISVGEWNAGADVRRGLVQFDFSSIPAEATITSAVLSIWVAGDTSDNARTISAYRVLRNWIGTQATWNIYITGNNWGTAGCSNTSTDREAGAIGTQSVAASPSVGDEIAITLTNASIQTMITDGGFTNNGWLLKVDTENNDLIDYDSSRGTTVEERPKLVINYSLPGGMFLVF